MNRLTAFIVPLLFLLPSHLFAINFEELDLPPAGAHEGQMLLGAFVTAGYAMGDIIDGENDFIDGTTHTFENETTKLFEVTHLPLSFGLVYEYMPIDYVGARVKLRRTYIAQRSTFGPDYKNWRGTLYKDYSFLAGFSLHATNRKRWDFVLSPLVGYAFYQFAATPVAAQIIDGYSGDRKRSGSGLIYGVGLDCTVYFSGGLFIALGYEWMRNTVDFSGGYDLTNPVTDARYMDGASSGRIDTHSVSFTAGYAFSN